MKSRIPWLGVLGMALIVAGCGIQGDGSLRPVNAVTLATLPKDMQAKNQSEIGSKPAPVEAVEADPVREPPVYGDINQPKKLDREPRESEGRPRAGGGRSPRPPSYLPGTLLSGAAASSDEDSKGSVEALYRQSCQPCHSLDLVEHQRLNRDDWEWVLEDMVETYGARWITPKQRSELLDFLVDRYGSEEPPAPAPASPVPARPTRR